MSIKQGIRDELLADATLVALVGDRVYSEFARQRDDFPYITFQRIGMNTSLILDGIDTLRDVTFRIDCYSRTVAEVETVKNRVRTILDGKTGSIGSVAVFLCSLESEQDLSELEDEAVRRVSLLFNINMHEG